MAHDFFKNFLSDLKVDLLDEFDRNFERKAFFDRSWPKVRFPNRRGSMMMRTGSLRRSIRASAAGQAIRFYSSLPYAVLHNEGGEVTVTAKMKRFFWAMYYKSSGAASKAKGQGKGRYSAEAEAWKAMALKKVGSRIRIDQRQFIGPHRQVDDCVERVFYKSMKEFEEFLYNQLKK